ncbi:MAG: hypothetical protein JF590_00445, partial [Gemmatimonadetes bacterium]|nr:hypothetical protein [Gemmatimonadota bacterium]
MRSIRLLPFSLLTLAGCHLAPKVAPGAVVEAFYAELLTRPIFGPPDSGAFTRIAPFLSDTLKARLLAARGALEAATKAAPAEKPPLADDDLFSSLMEGPTSFYVKATGEGKGRNVVLVQFEDRRGNSSVIWVDTAYVVPHDTTWLVDDIH